MKPGVLPLQLVVQILLNGVGRAHEREHLLHILVRMEVRPAGEIMNTSFLNQNLSSEIHVLEYMHHGPLLVMDVRQLLGLALPQQWRRCRSAASEVAPIQRNQLVQFLATWEMLREQIGWIAFTSDFPELHITRSHSFLNP